MPRLPGTRAKLQPDGAWPRFAMRTIAAGGCLPDTRAAHALWFFMIASHRILRKIDKEVIYEVDGVRQGPTEAERLHNLWLKPALATTRLYGVTLEEMFATPLVQAAIREIRKSGFEKGTGIVDPDPRVLGWIASGGKDTWVPRLGSFWFKTND